MSGKEGRLSGMFCAVLCATVVHIAMHTHMNRPNSCLLVRFSFPACVLQFICVVFSFSGLFLVRDLVSSVVSQEIGWEERLQNDLFYFCVEWDMKPQFSHQLKETCATNSQKFFP